MSHHDDDRGNFFDGVLNALTILAVVAIIGTMIWFIASSAYAASSLTPSSCTGYRGYEIVACVQERR